MKNSYLACLAMCALWVGCSKESYPEADGGSGGREQIPASGGNDAKGMGGNDSNGSGAAGNRVERRRGPQCQPYDEKEYTLPLETHFFDNYACIDCGDDCDTKPWPDVARTWTAHEDGLYRIRTTSEYTANSLEVHFGECVTSDLGAGGMGGFGGANEQNAGLCASPVVDEDGYSDQAVTVLARKGETYTLIVNARHEYLEKSDGARTNSVGLRVDELECPVLNKGRDEITELEGELPLQIEGWLSESAKRYRRTSCGGNDESSDGQSTVAFTAPYEGTYRFRLETDGRDQDGLLLALLQNDCLGDETACESGGPGSVELEALLSEGQKVVLVMTRIGQSYDATEVVLAVDRR